MPRATLKFKNAESLAEFVGRMIETSTALFEVDEVVEGGVIIFVVTFCGGY